MPKKPMKKGCRLVYRFMGGDGRWRPVKAAEARELVGKKIFGRFKATACEAGEADIVTDWNAPRAGTVRARVPRKMW